MIRTTHTTSKETNSSYELSRSRLHTIRVAYNTTLRGAVSMAAYEEQQPVATPVTRSIAPNHTMNHPSSQASEATTSLTTPEASLTSAVSATATSLHPASSSPATTVFNSSNPDRTLAESVARANLAAVLSEEG